MPSDWDRLQDLFHEALALPPAARAAHLERATDDPALRARVRALLVAHDTGGPLDAIAARLDAAGTREAEPLAPTQRVGRYEILEPIARGGMGSVYRARRADGAFDATVALKVLRRDLETEELRRRFLGERQILARITHPNIARLLDGGVTDEDQPYFVMEHVDGVPIDAYCDARRLSVGERLALFRTVCAAVQHAHRNLVVHRDLKPGNILVTPDGTVKLLDFGIAKVLDLEAFPRYAARTETGMRLLTPEYASPEQLRGDAVTTASDVYQLGLLLHLLLTGQVPRLADGALITPAGASTSREIEKPSTIVSGSARRGTAADAEAAPLDTRAIAATRATTPDRLRRRLAGDLDNIVLLALREEPERRYASVEQLDDDVRRHLEGLPVRARPERLGYVAAKFVRRHRAGVAAGGTIAVLLVGFAVAMGVQARRIALERDRAQQVSELLIGMFEAASPSVARGDTLTVFDLLARGADQVRTALEDRPALRGTMLGVLADVSNDLGDYETAAGLGWEAVDAWAAAAGPDDPRTVARLARVAGPVAATGLDSALAVAERAVARAPWRSGRGGLVRARALQAQAYFLQRKGEQLQAESVLTDALALYRRLPGDSARLGLASALVNRGWLHQNAGELDSAVARLRESLALRQELLDAEHPDYLNALGGLADLLRQQGRLAEAESLLVRDLALVRRYYPPEHPQHSSVLAAYAALLEDGGALDSAEVYYRAALEAEGRGGRNRSLGYAQGLGRFALFLQWRRADPVAAEPLFREVADIYRVVRGPRDAWTAQMEVNLATALLPQERYGEADSIFRRALPRLEEHYSPTSPALVPALVNHGLVLTRLGRLREAEAQLRRGYDNAVAGGNPAAIVPAAASLGILLVDRRRFAEAAPLLARAWETLEGGPNGLLKEWTADALARLHAAEGRAEEAARYRAAANAAGVDLP